MIFACYGSIRPFTDFTAVCLDGHAFLNSNSLISWLNYYRIYDDLVESTISSDQINLELGINYTRAVVELASG